LMGPTTRGGKPYTFTILREPVAQAISTWAYFVSSHTNMSTFSEVYASVASLPRNGPYDRVAAHWLNPMAHDLGWYESHGFSTTYDHNETEIWSWIAKMDSKLDQVLLLESLDESLVLLSRALGVPLEEMVTMHFRSSGAPPLRPTPAEIETMQMVNRVDFALYEHFSQVFHRRWASGASGKEADLDRLRELRAQVVQACSASSHGASSAGNRCPRALLAEEAEYTNHLIRRAIS